MGEVNLLEKLPTELISLIIPCLPLESLKELVLIDSRLPPLLGEYPAILEESLKRLPFQCLPQMLALTNLCSPDNANRTYRRLPGYARVESIKVLLEAGQVEVAERLAWIDREEDCRQFSDPSQGLYKRHLEWRIRMHSR